MLDLNQLGDIEILSLTIIGEARGEPIEGQVAVGSTIRNRLHNNPVKYTNYGVVCLERKQFSCWNLDDPNRPYLLELAERMIYGTLDDPFLRQCIWVANGIRSWDVKSNVDGNMYYMTSNLFNSDGRPGWARRPRNIKIYGRQTFFHV